MVTIHIEKDVGLEVDTLPESLFSIIKEYDEGSDGSLQLRLEPEDEQRAVSLIRRSCDRENYDPIRISRHSGTTRVRKAPVQDAEDNPEIAVEEPREVAEEQPVQAQRRNADADRDEAVPAETAVQEVNEVEVADAGPGADEAAVDPPADDEQAPPPQLFDLATGMVGPAESPGDVKIEKDSISVAIAKMLESDATNQAKQLKDAKAKFDKMFRELLILKRDIKMYEHDLDDHPIIKSMIDQTVKVKAYDDVDDVYFTDKELVIITNNLVTSEEVEGEFRDIGIIRIGVSLTAFFSPKAVDAERVISIRNLKHRYNTGSTIWECGHVQSDGSKCVGGTYDYLFEAFVNHDLEYIVESLLRFLTNPDSNDSWGKHMQNWAIAAEVKP